MKEIYRSFEGKLGVENQFGYIVYELNEMYEIHTLSVWSSGTHKFRAYKKNFDINKVNDIEYLAELESDIDNGRIDGQVVFRGKWCSPQKIQDKYQDVKWTKYVK